MRAASAMLLLALVCVTGGITWVFADTPLPSLPKGKGEKCVEPTDMMRRDHMKLLVHQRDETMHRGIRTKKHSLVECLNCHTQKDKQGTYIPINANGEFCQTCHVYSGVKMDCFECHATTPRRPTSVSERADGDPGSDITFRLGITP